MRFFLKIIEVLFMEKDFTKNIMKDPWYWIPGIILMIIVALSLFTGLGPLLGAAWRFFGMFFGGK